MGSVDDLIHPAVQHMAAKGYERATLDEMAIVNTMRRSICDSMSAYDNIKRWLQQENPHGLRGAELSKWATEIAEWVLPTQLRSTNAEGKREGYGEGRNAQVREGPVA